ncbi:MAG: ATP-binding protein [Halovenus sp.]
MSGYVAVCQDTTARKEYERMLERQNDRLKEFTDIRAVVDTAWDGIGCHPSASVHYDEVRSVSAGFDRLRELSEHLLRNSVEHGGDSVSIRVGPLARGFYVEDDGPGLPEERRDTVFDHGFSTDDEGSGYGLSIVRTIASAHGWDIRVTRFEITGIEFLE